MWSHKVTIGWDGPLWRTSVPILHDAGGPSEGHRIVQCQEIWVIGVFFSPIFGWIVLLQRGADFSKLLIHVQSRGSTPQPLQKFSAGEDMKC